MYTQHKNLKHGFTLIETITVVVIIILISVISFDFLMDTLGKMTVNSTADNVVEFFKNIQAKNVNYGVTDLLEANKVYYGVSFNRDSNNRSYYFSYKKNLTSTDEYVYLSNYIYFSSIALNNSLNLKFCADANYTLPVEPFSSGNNLEYLCTTSVTCDTTYTITIKSKMSNYSRNVIIDTSNNTGCLPKVYTQ